MANTIQLNPMDAGTLACPACGAAASLDARACGYCRVELHTRSCPGCFARVFVEAKHCLHCGAKLFDVPPEAAGAGAQACPRCRRSLVICAVGEAFLEECGGCGGTWVDAESFKSILRRRERSAAFTGMGSPVAAPYRAVTAAEKVQYLPCPRCGRLMNRLNFGRASGVIVDVCKTHGTWFDHDELRRVLAFVEAGGLDAAREREVERLKREAERARNAASTPPLPLGEGVRRTNLVDVLIGIFRLFGGSA